MKTYEELLNDLATRHDFNKSIGAGAKGIGIAALHQYFKNEKLKIELRKCLNLKQMQNTIQQLTGELTKERTPEQLQKFNEQFKRLIKMARV